MSENIIQGILNIIAVFIVVNILLFFFAFIMGGISLGINIESTCNKIDVNLERLYPVRVGCWFWKETPQQPTE